MIPDTTSATPAAVGARGTPLASLAIALNLVAVLFALGTWGSPVLRELALSPRALAAGCFLALLVAALGFFPALLVAVFAGAALGTIAGSALVFASATAAALAGFGLSRLGGPELFDRLAGRHAMVRALDRMLERRGFAGLLLLRLAPALPFGALHLALGQTRVTAAAFAASSLAMLPWISFCCYCGAVIRDVGQVAGRSGAYLATAFVVAAIAIGLTREATAAARRALDGATRA